MKATKTAKTKKSKSGFAALVIPLALLASICVYLLVMGDGSHFVGGDSKNAPLPGDYFGTVYKGGFIVPILMTLLLTVLTFVVERQLTISRAAGKGNVHNFVHQVKAYLAENNAEAAIEACDKQKGSVANVIRAVVVKYRVLESDNTMVKDQKLTSLQKEIEEATSLELPSLEENLVILATITSLATLMGLLGTVLGMIRAFAALANAGSPDSAALSQGISEALVNTAFGIGTSVLAVIFYNFFTSKIDKLTYSIDEAGFSIVQSYAANHK
jgi:biopolymer transport protein ExbB